MEFWKKMPEHGKKGVIESCWCGSCMKAVTIENFTLVFKKPDLILQGFCKVCGNDIVRLVEGA